VSVRGSSFLIELIAMHSNKGRKFPRGLQQRFSRFLRQMVDFKSANVFFESSYTKSEIPAEILAQRPLILDPMNPYDNRLGEQFHKPEMKVVLKRYKDCAELTLARIRHGKGWDQGGIEGLFKGLNDM
jgi:hypothetical protein